MLTTPTKAEPYKRVRLRYFKDQTNGHYAYLVPQDDFSGRIITLSHEPIWIDGIGVNGVVLLYNGRIANKRKA